MSKVGPKFDTWHCRHDSGSLGKLELMHDSKVRNENEPIYALMMLEESNLAYQIFLQIYQVSQ